jgi:hypothetical protein
MLNGIPLNRATSGGTGKDLVMESSYSVAPPNALEAIKNEMIGSLNTLTRRVLDTSKSKITMEKTLFHDLIPFTTRNWEAKAHPKLT